MKRLFLSAALAFSVNSSLKAQPFFVYDQQSSDETNVREGGAGSSAQPLGQSFTPTINEVGFIRLYLWSPYSPGNPPNVAVMHLWSGSLGGILVATSTPTSLADNVAGPANFIFETPAPVLPGQTYYFQPVALSGGFLVNITQEYEYSGGMAVVDSIPYSRSDFWFREGIIIPEPAMGAVLGLGLGLLLWARRSR